MPPLFEAMLDLQFLLLHVLTPMLIWMFEELMTLRRQEPGKSQVAFYINAPVVSSVGVGSLSL